MERQRKEFLGFLLFVSFSFHTISEFVFKNSQHLVVLAFRADKEEIISHSCAPMQFAVADFHRTVICLAAVEYHYAPPSIAI